MWYLPISSMTRKYSSPMGAIKGATTLNPNPSRIDIVWSGMSDPKLIC